ncbi:copper-binding protein [Massilia solisilvae]
MTRLFTVAVAAGGLVLASAQAGARMQDHAQMHAQMHAQHQAAPEQAAAELSSGEVQKVDKDTGTLTIQHGPLVNLGMPGMTMVFKARDAAMLGQVKVGDKIRFRAEQVNGAFTVTRLEPVR